MFSLACPFYIKLYAAIVIRLQPNASYLICSKRCPCCPRVILIPHVTTGWFTRQQTSRLGGSTRNGLDRCLRK